MCLSRHVSTSPAVLEKARFETVEHCIEAVYDECSRVLVLGTMPSPKSREEAFYYAHPRNRFWPVMERLFSLEDGSLSSVGARKAFLLDRHIALWDVLASCRIDGASDASIRDARPNDLSPILESAPIGAIFCTGSTAARLYRKLCEPQTDIPCTQLPSTSPANARLDLAALTEAYRPILDALEAQPDFRPCERRQGSRTSPPSS